MIQSFSDEGMVWLNNPTEWNVPDETGQQEGSGGHFAVEDDGKILKLAPPAFKDFWARTFYSPLLIKHDASALLCTVPADTECTLCIDFEYTPMSQFDQVFKLHCSIITFKLIMNFIAGWYIDIY
jgi:regulation of enolase protein 1 (concanavalin A-like superfamily)